MGLDMYLKAKVYLSKYTSEERLPSLQQIRDMFPEIKLTGNIDGVEVSFEVGYWRKANAIHSWFVENVQEGEDNCRKYYVDREDLQKLLDECRKVLASKDKAQELLPTKSGFFFGGTEYDEWYWQDIENTIRIIEYCLALPDDFDFEYQSSW